MLCLFVWYKIITLNMLRQISQSYDLSYEPQYSQLIPCPTHLCIRINTHVTRVSQINTSITSVRTVKWSHTLVILYLCTLVDSRKVYGPAFACTYFFYTQVTYTCIWLYIYSDISTHTHNCTHTYIHKYTHTRLAHMLQAVSQLRLLIPVLQRLHL